MTRSWLDAELVFYDNEVQEVLMNYRLLIKKVMRFKNRFLPVFFDILVQYKFSPFRNNSQKLPYSVWSLKCVFHSYIWFLETGPPKDSILLYSTMVARFFFELHETKRSKRSIYIFIELFLLPSLVVVLSRRTTLCSWMQFSCHDTLLFQKF